MTEIYLHIVARMADYMDTHPYSTIYVRQEKIRRKPKRLLSRQTKHGEMTTALTCPLIDKCIGKLPLNWFGKSEYSVG